MGEADGNSPSDMQNRLPKPAKIKSEKKVILTSQLVSKVVLLHGLLQSGPMLERLARGLSKGLDLRLLFCTSSSSSSPKQRLVQKHRPLKDPCTHRKAEPEFLSRARTVETFPSPASWLPPLLPCGLELKGLFGLGMPAESTNVK